MLRNQSCAVTECNGCNSLTWLQGHEEFDDEITLAGSGRVTPLADTTDQVPTAHEQGRDAATSSNEHAFIEQEHIAEQAGPSQAEG